MKVCVMSTEILIEEIVMSGATFMVLLTPVGFASGIFSAGDAEGVSVSSGTPPVLRRRASATAAAASTRPCPNHGLQVPSGAPMLLKAPASNGAIGEMSQLVLVSKLAEGVRG